MKSGFYLFVSPTRVVPVLVWGGEVYDGNSQSVIDLWNDGVFHLMFLPGNRPGVRP